jgi:hypothetical protein
MPTNHPEVIISILPIPKASNDGTLNGIVNHHDHPGATIRMQFGV